MVYVACYWRPESIDAYRFISYNRTVATATGRGDIHTYVGREVGSIVLVELNSGVAPMAWHYPRNIISPTDTSVGSV